MIYAISDLHLNNNNLTKLRGSLPRDFRVEIKNNWNRRLIDCDTTIIAGDLGDDPYFIIDYLRKLKGHKILVVGNHDTKWLEMYDRAKVFSLITDVFTQKHKDLGTITYNHKYNKNTCSDIQIFGHTHTYCEYNKYLKYYTDLKSYNCCADLNYFAPSLLCELISNKDHHILVY